MGRAGVLVLDLRGNGGGNTPWKLRKALLRGRGGHEWRWQTIEERVPTPLLMRILAPIAVRLYAPPRWEGGVVLLVDAGCFSACEDLVGSLRGAPGVRIVGETTGGSTGQPVTLVIDQGFSTRVSARRVALPDGTPFEGRGIDPDTRAGRSATDIAAGVDPALETAVAEARRLGRSR
jgi:carboxyl-terminal processing protease